VIQLLHKLEEMKLIKIGRRKIKERLQTVYYFLEFDLASIEPGEVGGKP
jgi:hypothetical protein